MVVDGEDFHIFAPLIEITSPVENGFDGLPALFGVHSVEVLTATMRTEVLEAGTMDSFTFDQIENLIKVFAGFASQVKAQPSLLADMDAVSKAFYSAFVGSLDSQKAVVNFGEGAIETDTDIRELEVFQLTGYFRGNQSSVGWFRGIALRSVAESTSSRSYTSRAGARTIFPPEIGRGKVVRYTM